MEIDHTFVDPVLRGQGVAGQLMEALVRTLRERGLKAIPTCAYAVEWFQMHPKSSDVLHPPYFQNTTCEYEWH